MFNERLYWFYHSLLVMGLFGGLLSAHASTIGDTPEIAKLRAQFENAVISNNPEAVAKFVSDDYVMLQPNANGPDTYGKKAYLDYRGTLAKITRLDVEPVRVISCGNWAFEIGKESLDVTTPEGVDFSTSARVVKVLNKTRDGCRYARTVRAWAKNSYITPPAPGSLFSTGFATWTPDTSSDPVLVKEMLDSMADNTRALVAGGDMVIPQQDVAAVGFPGPVGYGQEWEMNTREEYMQNRKYVAFTPYDELRKYPEEGVVCEKDMAFAWG